MFVCFLCRCCRFGLLLFVVLCVFVCLFRSLLTNVGLLCCCLLPCLFCVLCVFVHDLIISVGVAVICCLLLLRQL